MERLPIGKTKVAIADNVALPAQSSSTPTPTSIVLPSGPIDSREVCSVTYPTRFQVGAKAFVAVGSRLNLRSRPGLEARTVGQLPPGEEVEIVDGPACAANMVWWYVESAGSVVGWASEGSTAEYFLDPLSGVAANESLPTFGQAPVDNAASCNNVDSLRDRDTVCWVVVPAGTFTMGSSNAGIIKTLAECNETEGVETGQPCQAAWFNEPERSVTLDSFEITRFEITNAQYQQCVQAGVCQQAGWRITDNDVLLKSIFFEDQYPVVGVNWYDAVSYCEWIGARLPTELEWEKAARGTDGRRYPWGDEYRSSYANLDSGTPYPIGSFPLGASPYGAMDMAGNVFEWTTTSVGNNYILRGGSWSKYPFRGRVSDRGTQLGRDFANYDVGFRCVR